MKWERIPVGPIQANAYILSHDDGTCVIFDPGGEGDKIVRHIEEQGLTPLAILLTHAHFDHIGGINEVKKKWELPIYIHENEKEWLTNPALNGSAYFGIGQVELLETPGHSPGSISYYCKEIEAVFSGDVLFLGSIGRTDLPGGNHEQLLRSIHDKLLTLPEETIVLSGHGRETTIGAEMDTNPFLHGF